MRVNIRGVAAVVTLILGLSLIGCGDDGSESASGGAGGGNAQSSESIPLAAMFDLTGVAGVYGPSTKAGFEYAVKEINEAGGIDGRKIDADVQDTGSDQKQALTLINKAIGGDAVAMISGNISSVAVATAPVSQREGLAQIGIQSGSPGFVEVGDHIFRITMPQRFLYANLAKYASAEAGVKSSAVIYAADVPTLVEVAEKAWPAAAEENGISVTGRYETQSTDKDYSSIVRKVAAANPDAVLVGGVGQQNITIMSQLRRAGWEGRFLATPGVASGVLKALGDDANGVLYPLSFHPVLDPEWSKRFETAMGRAPDNFSAEAHDAVQLFRRGVENAKGELTRESLAAGLRAATDAGFEGAQGPITFEKRDARTPGVVVEWMNGAERLVFDGAKDGG
jgi:branched-chain amino acid transport system substrate-binding protein